MQLLIISPSTERGGAEEYALTLASAAVKNGWTVYAAFPEKEATKQLIQDFKQQNVTYYPLAIGDRGEKSKNVSFLLSLLRFAQTLFLLLKVQPDVVLVDLPSPHLAFTSILACGFLKVPTAVVFQLIPFHLSLGRNKLNIYAWARAREQQWITVSEHDRKQISETFQVPYHTVRCIYNGAKISTTSTIRTCEEISTLRQQVREELGLPENSQILLTVARLSSQKGHSFLIPMIPEITTEFPSVKFVWVGEGEERETLMAQVQTLEVEDKVSFLGYRTDISRLLLAADIFVFPTNFEGFPFALLEAMAYGLPVVASNASSIPEIITNKVHGLLFQTKNSTDLFNQVQWALKNPKPMQEMARNAQKRVQEFSETRMLQETLGLLQELGCTHCESKELLQN